jgi:hypothetical protein
MNPLSIPLPQGEGIQCARWAERSHHLTKPDLLNLLRDKCASLGQSNVAKQLGYSAAAISQILSNSYKGDSATILNRVEVVFGGLSVSCPVLGEIPMANCSDEQKKPFAATSHQRVALWKACQACDHNSGRRQP